MGKIRDLYTGIVEAVRSYRVDSICRKQASSSNPRVNIEMISSSDEAASQGSYATQRQTDFVLRAGKRSPVVIHSIRQIVPLFSNEISGLERERFETAVKLGKELAQRYSLGVSIGGAA